MLFKSIAHAETFEFFAHNSCNLVIYIQTRRIYFCILNSNNLIIYCREYINQNQSPDLLFCKYAFEQENSLRHSYESVKVYIDADFCLIPDEKEFILKRHQFAVALLNEDIEEHELYYHPIEQSKIAGLFVPRQLYINLLNEYLPAYELSNSNGLLFQMARTLYKEHFPLLLIQILDQHVNLLGYKKEQLQFIQRYPYRSGLDLVYFIKLASSILAQDSELDRYLLGEIDDKGILMKTILKYFPSIRFPLALQERTYQPGESNSWWKYSYFS